MKLVLLAGGLGMRMYPITEKIPKPMLEIHGKPMLEYQIEWAKKNGITDIIICSGYLSEQIEDYFGDGSKWGVDITYSIEQEPLGTGGPLKLVEDMLDDDFMVLNADILTKVDARKAMKFHKEKKSKLTILSHVSSHPEDSDLIEFDTDGKVVKLWNKPHKEKTLPQHSHAGIYFLHPDALKFLEDGEKASLQKDLIPKVFASSGVFAYPTEEFMMDVGTFDRLKKIELMILKKEFP